MIIQARRWDPITGTTSAAIGTGTDIARATTDIFTKPYQEFNRAKGQSRPSTCRSTSQTTTPTPTPTADSQNSAEGSSSMDSNRDPRSNWDTTGAAITASAKGVGRIVRSYYKGVLVDIPLATTEGLRAVPRLYGEDVEQYDVRDWRTGARTGGRNFAHGMTNGFTDIFRQPYKGAVEEGPLGIAKGFFKGGVGLGTKMSAGGLP